MRHSCCPRFPGESLECSMLSVQTRYLQNSRATSVEAFAQLCGARQEIATAVGQKAGSFIPPVSTLCAPAVCKEIGKADCNPQPASLLAVCLQGECVYRTSESERGHAQNFWREILTRTAVSETPAPEVELDIQRDLVCSARPWSYLRQMDLQPRVLRKTGSASV